MIDYLQPLQHSSFYPTKLDFDKDSCLQEKCLNSNDHLVFHAVEHNNMLST